MTVLEPLSTLFEVFSGETVHLPQELASIYGSLSFPKTPGRPHTISNFVESLDGVTTLDDPSFPGGGPISGFSPHDRFVMGLLRSVADAVIVGAGTLRSVPKHLWTPAHVFPEMSDQWARLRSALGKSSHPLNVILTASGRLGSGFHVLQQRDVPVLILTTFPGLRALRDNDFPPNIELAAAAAGDELTPREVMSAIADRATADLILVEGGPSVMGNFIGANLLDELFLTLAPQIAGRSAASERPGLVSGRAFAPNDPRWATLMSVKRAAQHLFLRYALETAATRP